MSNLSKHQFFSVVAPWALLVYLQGSPIFPSVRIAYSYIKSHGTLIAWNNLTHMQVADGKVTSYWHGEYVIEQTGQLVRQSGDKVLPEALRAYKTLYHCYADEDLFYQFKKKRQITKAESPYIQAKAFINIRKEEKFLVDLIELFIKQYQLECYDQIYTFFDKPSHILGENIIPVIHEEELITIAFYIDNLIYLSLRKIQEFEKVKIEKSNGIVRLNGHIVKAFTIDNLCYVSLEDLKKFLLIQVEWDQHAKVLSLY